MLCGVLCAGLCVCVCLQRNRARHGAEQKNIMAGGLRPPAASRLTGFSHGIYFRHRSIIACSFAAAAAAASFNTNQHATHAQVP